ncbi:MAG: 50S ribosomal protein L25 [Tidjanibacter sp.]|nr:50S ribosomal protein L25 [Tidjanibacter sp.]
MKKMQLSGVLRTDFGKKGTKAVRRNEQVPCALYGGTDEPIYFAVDQKALKPLLNSIYSYIVEFDIDGTKAVGVLQSAQYHPVKDYPMHVDFLRVVEGKPVAIEVPIKVVGNSEGVKASGKLSIQRRKIRVSALEQNLPDVIELDITNLTIGKAIFAGDVKVEGVTVLTPATTSLCTVLTTRAARSAEAAAQNA